MRKEAYHDTIGEFDQTVFYRNYLFFVYNYGAVTSDKPRAQKVQGVFDGIPDCNFRSVESMIANGVGNSFDRIHINNIR